MRAFSAQIFACGSAAIVVVVIWVGIGWVKPRRGGYL
jgi:hypothetical protein